MDVAALLIPGKFIKPMARPMSHLIVEMRQFADQCAVNLASWQNEEARLNGSGDRDATCSSDFLFPSLRSPEDFLLSFPLTLPAFALGQPEEQQPVLLPPLSPSHLSPTSSSMDSHSDGHRVDLTPPDSPAPSFGSGSFVLRSKCSSSSLRTMSSVNKNDATVAMRAAYQAGVRKKRSFYNRYSWTSDLNPMASSPNLAIPRSSTVVTNTVDAVNGTSQVVGTVQ